MHDVSLLKEKALAHIEKADAISVLEQLRVDYLGKKGILADCMKELMTVSAEERPKVGQKINEVKRSIAEAIEARLNDLTEQALAKKLSEQSIDVTLPGRMSQIGARHPVMQTRDRLCHYFKNLGFEVVTGPEIETDYYNFTALNIPSHHPARAMHDTFYFGNGELLRTHTSPVQIRSMLEKEPPFRLIAPGRVYRCDSDMTHTPMFHQVEGLLIDKEANLSGLKSLLHHFFSDFFGKEVPVRFRPSYFPFTEPSAEVDIGCTQCSGSGCRSCKYTGWLEVMGCGMVHPNVLRAVSIDPDVYQGWAFGMGLDRLAMLYYGIDDLRKLFENDVQFLAQF